MEGLHVPYVVLIDMNGTFTGQQMKRRDADVRNSLHWPAVMPICLDVSVRCICSLSKRRGQIRSIQPASCSQRENLVCRLDRSLSSCTSGCVLCAQKIFRLDRPGHYLAIDAEPVRMEFRPAPCIVQRIAEFGDNLALQADVVEK